MGININADIGFMFIFVVAFVAQGIAFGIGVNVILRNRGYETENWFWWGFFFSWIAVVVAFSKPENYVEVMDDSEHSRDVLKDGGWVCSFCNTLNGNYVTSCSCGKNRDESEQHKRETERWESLRNASLSGDNMAYREKAINNENQVIELIEKYKKLLESGAITQKEFEDKKRSLLNSL